MLKRGQNLAVAFILIICFILCLLSHEKGHNLGGDFSLYKKQKQRFHFNLETGLIVGVLLLFVGVLWSYFNISAWGGTGYSELNPSSFMRKVIPAVFLISLGVQTMGSSFVMALINEQKNNVVYKLGFNNKE